ncbi:MAG: hypothetical protein WDA20_06625 [Desulfuromonadales bacterium]
MRLLLKSFILLASLTGALVCLFSAGGAQLLCETQGCRIYAGYGVFGISFYSLGAAGFLLIFLLTLLHPRRFTRTLLSLGLLAALALDTLFLGYQTLFWPCTSCLLVALLLGLIVAAGLVYFPLAGKRLFFVVGALWTVLFIFLGIATLKETLLRPWPLFGPADAAIQVYFSPDCPACRQTVGQLLDDPATRAQTVFYPIAKNAQDLQQIARYLEENAQSADADRFLALFTDDLPESAPALDWRHRLRLLANKATLARLGASSVPLVVAPFLPQPDPPAFDLNPFSPPDFSPPLDGCSAFEEKACD